MFGLTTPLPRPFIVCLALIAQGALANEPEEIFPELPAYIVVGEPASAGDLDAIRTLMMSSGQGWAEGNAGQVAVVYADDAEWMNAFGDVRRGREAIEGYLTDLFSYDEEGMGENEQANGRMISMRYVGDDVVILHSMTISNRAGALEGADHRQVHSTSVLAKEEGQWTVVHEHISDARPRTTIKED
ncbi:MAG: SgcJ/EcaC family oxidoreductase [Pseudomonadota bacterium]